jgi:hypothetical protein
MGEEKKRREKLITSSVVVSGFLRIGILSFIK